MRYVAEDFMSRPLTIEPGTPTRDAAVTMDLYRISCLPVVEQDGTLCGVLSKTDVLHETIERQGKEPRPVQEVMSPTAVSCGRLTSVKDVARLMRDHRVHHVMVVEEKRLVGVVSAIDLAEAMYDVTEMLRDVGRQ